VTLRATPKARRLLATILSCLAGVMVVSAAGFLGYPKYTDMKANRQQKVLRRSSPLPRTQAGVPDRRSAGCGSKKVVLAEGSANDPDPDPEASPRHGRGPGHLRSGAGRRGGALSQTPLPCVNSGNVGIAGHRTMNGHPFQRLDTLTAGDKVVLTHAVRVVHLPDRGRGRRARQPYVTEPTTGPCRPRLRSRCSP